MGGPERPEPTGPEQLALGGPERPEPTGPEGAREAVRARRLAEVFGDMLPEATSDDRADRPEPDPERWYTENRPPHHDPR